MKTYIIYEWGTPIIVCKSDEKLTQVKNEVKKYLTCTYSEYGDFFDLSVLKFPTSDEGGLLQVVFREDGFEKVLHIDLVEEKIILY